MNIFWKTKTLLAAGILFVSTLALADTGQGIMRLSPDEAVSLAIRNNLDLDAIRISTGTARRTSAHAWNQFIPTVDVGGTVFRLNTVPEGIDLGIPGIPPMGGGHRWGAAGSISATINFNFGMIEEMKKLRLDYEKGLISYQKASAQLERDIRKAYHNILFLHEYIALLQGSLESAERQVGIAQANFRAGISSEFSLLQAQVTRENIRPIIDQAKGGLRLSMMQFSMFLGLPHDIEFELIPIDTSISPIALDTAELIRKAAAGQPDVQELRQEILIMNSLRQSSRLWLFTPNISLGWNADPTFTMNPWKDSWFERNSWQQQSGAFSLTLSFRLNGLLPFGTEQQNVRTLDDQIRIAHIGLAQLIRGTEIEIHNAVMTLERLLLSKEVLQQTVTLAERSFSLAETSYRAGILDIFQVQNAELSLRQARLQLYEQQFNYLNSLIDLEYALGVPFGSMATVRYHE